MFDGSNTKLTLTTAPGAPATHWQQMRCLFQHPISVQDGDCLVGKVTLRATRQQSYIAHGDIRWRRGLIALLSSLLPRGST